MRVAAVGDNVLDRYVDLGIVAPGGNALNVAVGVRREGITSAYLGAIGTDEAGVIIRDALVVEDVDVSHLKTVPGDSAFAIVRHVGTDRYFGQGSLGVSLLTLTDLDREFLATFDVVHTSYGSRLESTLPSLSARSRISYDFSSNLDLEFASPVLPSCWLATFSASDLSDDEVRSFATDVLAAGADYALVTRGSRGAYIASADDHASTPTVAAEVLDTLGAGDAFVASTIAGLLRGDGLEATILSAARSAARTCEHYGAFGYVLDDRDTDPVDARVHGALWKPSSNSDH